jgi:lycopene beta-cyclase
MSSINVTSPFLGENLENNQSAPPFEGEQIDYIITGAGASGLSLLCHWIDTGKFNDKKILLIDRAPKNQNDRTWCFWQSETSIFEPIVYKTWQHTYFYSPMFSDPMNIAPYQYKMIRGIDFYNYALQKIAQHPNIRLIYSSVEKIESQATYASVHTAEAIYTAPYIFNSILFKNPDLQDKIYLLQHFKGWVIETPTSTFDTEEATLMDFRIDQQGDCRFFYVLPTSPTQALVEYTIFSENTLDQEEYDKNIKDYLQNYLHLDDYQIKEVEFGIIPMTNAKFSKKEGNRIFNIGIAGGQTKGSTGYTFTYMQLQSQYITQSILETGIPKIENSRIRNRFNFYDSVLLHILHHRLMPLRDIFALLFKRNKPSQVLKFLDNQTTLLEEIRIFITLPILLFSKAALKTVFHTMKLYLRR